MCGLCGVLTNQVSLSEYEKFLDLLLVSQFRGRHSTGAFSVKKRETKKEEPRWSVGSQKQAVTSGYFIEANWPALKETLWGDGSARMIAGHCRHATRGKITAANAHPYNFSNIIGMHNGTLSENLVHPNIPVVKKKDKKGVPITVDETDSESFYRYLNDHTIDEAIDKLTYNDAYAFVWYDKRVRTLNFLRNEKRPLFFGGTSKNTMYWASEKEFLMFVLNRNNFGSYTSNMDNLMEVPANILCTFDLNADNPCTAFTTREVKKKWVAPKYSYGPHSGHGYGGYRGETYSSAIADADWWENGGDTNPWDDDGGAMATPPKPPESILSLEERKKQWKDLEDKFNKKKPTDIVTPVREYKLDTQWVSQERYQALLEKGCSWCNDQAAFTDNVKWLDNSAYVCSLCKETDEVKEYLGAKK